MNRRSFTSFTVLLGVAAAGCASAPAYRVAFESRAQPRPAGTVLVVLSAAPIQTLADGSTRETGYFLNEFYEPYDALVDAGYAVAIATPGGRPPALDPESLDEKYWDNPMVLAAARKLVDELPQMKAPLRLEDVAARSAEYQAIIVPGGQGVMVDLLDDPVLHALLREFGDTDRPVGLICHAPAILSRMAADPNPFAGRRVTSVSGIEEWYIETFVMDADAQVRAIGDTLDDNGFRHEAAFPGRSNAVRDCNLVTSQNPFSSGAFNDLFLAAMMDWRRSGRCVPHGDG